MLAAPSSGATGAVTDAFTAGALLVMLTGSMVPDPYEQGGRETRLARVIGLGVAVIVSLMQVG